MMLAVPSRGEDSEAGLTLVEVLLAVAILGIGVVAVVGGMMTSIQVSDLGRRQSEGQVGLRAYAEAVVGAGYTDCAGAATYDPGNVGFTVPAGYTATSAVTYWTAGSGSFTNTSCGTDSGLQRVTLTVSATDGRGQEVLRLVKRKP